MNDFTLAEHFVVFLDAVAEEQETTIFKYSKYVRITRGNKSDRMQSAKVKKTKKEFRIRKYLP